MLSNLYIMVFKNSNLIKVGKANDVLSRHETIKKWWGELDYKNSYYLEMPLDKVFVVERMLHELVKAHSANQQSGDGHTEIFFNNALHCIVEHLQLYIKHSHDDVTLVKGITPKVKKVLHKNTTPDEVKKSKPKVKKPVVDDLAILQSNLKTSTQMLNWLYDMRETVDYRIDVINGYVMLHVDNLRNAQKIADKAFNVFCCKHKLTCANIMTSYNICENTCTFTLAYRVKYNVQQLNNFSNSISDIIDKLIAHKETVVC